MAYTVWCNCQLLGNGSISFDEFANLMRSYRSNKRSQSVDSLAGDALLRETFEVFDKDQDGYLNAEDLRFCVFAASWVLSVVYKHPDTYMATLDYFAVWL